jgi:hypothetical protein
MTVRGDKQVVGRPGEVAEVERRCHLPLWVDVVDLWLEEGRHHERPVGQPAQPRGVLDLGLHGDVTGFAHRAHPTCRSVAEPEPVVVPTGSFTVDDAIDKWHRLNCFDLGHRFTCSSNVNVCARVSGFSALSLLHRVFGGTPLQVPGQFEKPTVPCFSRCCKRTVCTRPRNAPNGTNARRRITTGGTVFWQSRQRAPTLANVQDDGL